MAVAERGGFGCGVAVGDAVGAGVGADGEARVAIAVGVAPARVASEAVPQAARTLTSNSATIGSSV
jgi:hypothetical protein